MFVIFGGIFLLVVGLGYGGSIMVQKRREISQQVNDSRQALEEVRRLTQEIRSMGTRGTVLDGKAQFQSRVADLAGQHELSASSMKIQDQEGGGVIAYNLQVEFRAVPLSNVIRFLHSIEYSRSVPVHVSQLIVDPSTSAREVYDVSMILTMIESKGSE